MYLVVEKTLSFIWRINENLVCVLRLKCMLRKTQRVEKLFNSTAAKCCLLLILKKCFQVSAVLCDDDIMLTIKPGQVMNLTRYILPSQRVKLIFSTKLWSGALLVFFFCSAGLARKKGVCLMISVSVPIFFPYFSLTSLSSSLYCTSVNMCYPLLFTRWGLQSCNLSLYTHDHSYTRKVDFDEREK